MHNDHHPTDADVNKALTRHYEHVEIDDSYGRDLLLSMQHAAARPVNRLLEMRWVWGGMTAAAFVLICFGVVQLFTAKVNAGKLFAVTELRSSVTDGSGHALKVGDYVTAGELLRTGRGGRITLVARNGSLIHLDELSELSVDAGGNAIVNKGRLFCRNRMHEIKKIGTPAGSIRLLGTVLDASVVDKNTTAVTVVEGKVQLINAHGKRVIEEGKRAMMAVSQTPGEGTPVDVTRETAWYDGRDQIVSDSGDVAYVVWRKKGLTDRQQRAITEVWTMKSDGSGKRMVTALIDTSNWLGDWTRDGQWIIMRTMGPTNMSDPAMPVMPHMLRFVNISTGQDEYLPLPTDFSIESASVSPDGKRIAINGERECNFWLTDKAPGRAVTERGIWIFDTGTHELNPILTGDKRRFNASTPVWSPDNKRLAVCEWKGNDKPQHILIVDTHTGEVRPLVEGGNPAFSPDGTKLAYSLHSRSPQKDWVGSVYVTSVTGDGQSQLVASVTDAIRGVTWSPDGSRIAFYTSSIRGNTYVVRSAEADGLGMCDICSLKGCIDKVAWDRNGQTIYVKTYDTILKAAADGSGLTADLGGNEDDSTPSDEVREQLAQARSVIAESTERSVKGQIKIYQGRLNEGRRMLRESAQVLSELPWKYPLAHISVSDSAVYADASVGFASVSDEQALSTACTIHMFFTRMGLEWFCRGKNKLPSNTDAIKKAGGYGCSTHGVPDSRIDGLTCPGKHRSKPVPLIYTAPVNGEPKIGDVIFRCPNHPKHKVVWDKYLERSRNRPLPGSAAGK